ncbi:Major facilitator superfamily domain general substrate transporter [Penicillium angulare]|uniref:Major facilitator superfamily domain general substrate transporter n=1 Tax=Penicillium angulare TaxID=116970 RepID=UPI0025410D6A|nr:Major facilitator superfamily domain general substrate transporter [Penicillium angulare]KAJ5291198.1 Major facilitator superfamily domain general substrate transporter [Penicillium angulare]
MQAREGEAMEVLACEAMPVDDPLIRTQQDEIKYSITYEVENSVPWRDLLRRRKGDNTKWCRHAGHAAIPRYD